MNPALPVVAMLIPLTHLSRPMYVRFRQCDFQLTQLQCTDSRDVDDRAVNLAG